MKIETFRGSPEQIGTAYGQRYRNHIKKNTKALIDSIGQDQRTSSNFQMWVCQLERKVKNCAPDLLIEIEAVAKASGVSYEDILLLNLRGWQYSYYCGHEGADTCSSMIIRLQDGADCNMGALDDAKEFYDCPIRIIPDSGFSFITMPIIGMSGGNRGMNSAGLVCGISSQILPGLIKTDAFFQQDIAMRIILQTCSTVEQVRLFCESHPFTLNLAVSDANGGRFCAQCTAAGIYELEHTEPHILTNHIIKDEWINELRDQGVVRFPESETTRIRRGRLLSFFKKFNGCCSIGDIEEMLASKDSTDKGAINNIRSLFITIACPERDSGGLYIMCPNQNRGFEYVSIEER